MLMHAIAHSVRTMYLYVRYEHRRESALKVDSGTGELNPRQYYAWLCGTTLCRLSYPAIVILIIIIIDSVTDNAILGWTSFTEHVAASAL